MRMQKQGRWQILLAGVVLNLCMSCINTFSAFVQPISELTGWGQEEITLAYTLYNTVVCVMGIVIGALGGRVRIRALMYAGTGLYALGWIVAGCARTLWMLYLGFGVLAGMGAGSLYNYCITNTLKWFPDKKGTVSGIILAALALGPALCAPLTTVLLERMSVFAACRVFGLAFGGLMFLVGWLMRTPPEQSLTGQEGERADAAPRELTWRQMLRCSSFYLLFFIFAFACSPNMMLTGAVASIGQEQAGMSAAMASAAVALLALSNFCGRLFFGALSDRLGRYQTLLLTEGICLVAVLLLSRAASSGFFLTTMCVVGACGGAVMVMFPPIVSERYGAKHSGLNYSILYIAYAVASLLGPQLSAHCRQTTGSYTAAFHWAAAFLTTAGVLLFLVSRKKRR